MSFNVGRWINTKAIPSFGVVMRMKGSASGSDITISEL